MVELVERRFNRVTLIWAGGEHDFALGIGELRAVQEATSTGPLAVLRRLQGGSWQVDDVLAVLRHGLAGAGKSAEEARRLVGNAEATTPMLQLAITAQLVIAAAVIGMPDDTPGKAEAPEETTRSASGAFPESTETAS